MAARKKTRKAARKSARKAAKKTAKKATKQKAKGKAKKAAKKAAKKKVKKTPAKAKAKSKRVPTASGELVRTRPSTISKRLLGPSTTSGGKSSSSGLSYTNPAREAMLKKLLR